MISEIKERDLFLSEQVNQASMKNVIEKIIMINKSDDMIEKKGELYGFTYKRAPIKIYIDSFGGSVYQCLGLIGVMENSKTEIHTIVTGAAMSAGFMILISGHKRFAYKYATPLYHQASSFLHGELKKMEDDVEEIKRLQVLLEKIVLEKTSIKKDKLKQIYTEKVDWFMDVKEAERLNVIDEII